MLYPLSWFYMIAIKKLISQQMTGTNELMHMDFTGLTMIQPPEAPSWIEWWESLLKIQFQCQLGGSTSQGCGKFFRNLYIL